MASRSDQKDGELNCHTLLPPGVDQAFVDPDIAVPKHSRTKFKGNIFSILFFTWMDPLFWLGCRHNLQQTDLYAHPRETDSERVLNKFNRYWSQELERKRCGGRARLWVAILKCRWKELTIQGVLYFLEHCLTPCLPVTLGYLAESLAIQDPTEEDTRKAYLYATSLVLGTLAVVMLHVHATMISREAGMVCRIIALGAIYQKVLTLDQVTLGNRSIGHTVNLASNDVQKFDEIFDYFHVLWNCPIFLIVFSYLVYLEVGWSGLLVTGFVVLQFLLQLFLARTFTKLRFKSAKVTDRRIKVMNEVISGIRVIKMYAWEYAFKRVVAKLRRKESIVIFLGGLIRVGVLAYLYGFAIPVMTVLIFTAYTGVAGGTLTPRRVFTVLALVTFVRLVLIDRLIRSLFFVSECWVALSRIKKLLELEELSFTAEGCSQFYSERKERGLHGTSCEEMEIRPDGTKYSPLLKSRRLPTEQVFVRVQDLLVSWTSDRKKPVLSHVSLEVERTHGNENSNLVAVIGPVGAGKSSLLQCLLGELKPMEGCVEVGGRVSYASQEPWVFSGTLRENILYGLPYQKDWYDAVVQACALDKDIFELIYGDLTLVGERGVTLSGGQKARVNLARAVYHKADVYLLDDPLSAVDTAVARHLFERVICGLLCDSIVILVTHQVHFVQNASKILAIDKGLVETFLSHEELVLKLGNSFQSLGLRRDDKRDEFLIRDEDEEVETIAQPVPSLQKKRPLVHQEDDVLQPLETVPSIQSLYSMVGEESSTIDNNEILLAAGFIKATLDVVQGLSPDFRDFNSFKVHRQAPPEEDRAQGSISTATYYRYFRAGGSYILLLIVLLIFIMGEGSIVAADWWLADWTRCSTLNQSALALDNNTLQGTCKLSTNQRLVIYAGATGLTIITNFARTIMFYFLCVNASRVLHNRMFASVLRAPILFFDTNPIGRVLNRFSKDVGFLDDVLPFHFCEYLMLLLRFLAIFALASAANYWVLIPAVILVGTVLFVRWYYLKTARNIKRLEAVARSPLYSHISTTIQGLPTIRSYKMESMAMKQFHQYQNEHTQGSHLYNACARWFSVRVDLLIVGVLATMAFSSIPLASSLDASLVSLGLTYAVSLNILLQYGVALGAEVESVMVSAERIMAYGRLESEAPLETLPPNERPPQHWPDQGKIEMEEVSFRYSSDLPLVLKSLSFSIKPSEKVGIVGRTGAGKSSLVAVLFRMAEPFGEVTIDGINTKEIGLHDLRKNLSIIPQDPVLFSGTMRYNLDPFNDYSDVELWDALEQVQLKSVVENVEGQLHGLVSEGGTNFSVGQRQLVCLARALLRRNKILVLDEATANVDNKTDEIIQQAIRDQFSQCTVITIAHRLNTIMDSDMILVLNKGQVKEFGGPYALLQNSKSQFKRMVEQTGPTASKKLYQMALDAYNHSTEYVDSDISRKNN